MVIGNWTRQQLLVAYSLYSQIPFGRFDQRTPEIIAAAELLGRTPSAVAMKLSNIASLDPAITSTGRVGLPGASNADKAMWTEMTSNPELFDTEAQAAARKYGIGVAPEPEPAGVDVLDYTGVTREAVTMVRIGQGFFRRTVLSAYQNKCCITGLAEPSLLVASHIVPWRTDPENRLNPTNGLCLSALHDRAFDTGIITITDRMTVRVSRDIAQGGTFFESAVAAYDGQRIAEPSQFAPDREFLRFHQENIFQS